MSRQFNSTTLCVGSACLNETDIQTAKENPIAKFVCNGDSCLNSTDISLIKNLPNMVNSTRHCISSECMVSSDLATLKTLPVLVNTSSLCSGSNCLGASDISLLKTLIANNTTPPAPLIVQEQTNNSTVSLYAGTGNAGSTDGPRLNSTFNQPVGLVITNDGTMFVLEKLSHMIRRIWPNGTVSRFVGSGSAGNADGQGSAASFDTPSGFSLGLNGNLYVADSNNHRIRVVTPSGAVSTMAGSTMGTVDANGTSAKFNFPTGIGFTSDGTMYIVDHFSHRIRRMSPSGNVTTIAGNGTSSSIDGNGTAATFSNPFGVVVDQDDRIYISETSGNRIRRMTTAGQVTIFAGSGVSSFADGQGTSAAFRNPYGMALSSNGFIYVADYANNRVRMVSISTGVVSTVVGTGSTAFVDGIGSVATVRELQGVGVSPNGTLYIAETGAHRIRRVSN